MKYVYKYVLVSIKHVRDTFFDIVKIGENSIAISTTIYICLTSRRAIIYAQIVNNQPL